MEEVLKRLEAVAERLEKVSARGGSGATADEIPEFVEYYDEVMEVVKPFCSKSKSAFKNEVSQVAELIQSGFEKIREFLIMSSKTKRPVDQMVLQGLAKPFKDISNAISDIEKKCKNREILNHLKAAAEISSGYLWVVMDKRPAQFVKEMIDAGMFYSNKVLTEFKAKGPEHKEYVEGLLGSFRSMFKYVEEYHKQGLAWNPSGGDASSCKSAAATPKPAVEEPPKASGTGQAALFASLNKGSGVTSGLKKVDDSQKTHKNPELRGKTAPTEAKSGVKGPTTRTETKPQKTVFELVDNRWEVCGQGATTLNIENANIKQFVNLLNCKETTVVIKDKVNGISMVGCFKCNVVVMKGSISSLETVNCQRCNIQTSGLVPTISINSSDDLNLYVAHDCTSTLIVTSKSTGVNVSIMKEDGDTTELPIPEQFSTTIVDGKLVTESVVHE